MKNLCGMRSLAVLATLLILVGSCTKNTNHPDSPTPGTPTDSVSNPDKQLLIGWWHTTDSLYDYVYRYFGSDSFYYQGNNYSSTGKWWLSHDTIRLLIDQGTAKNSAVITIKLAKLTSDSLTLQAADHRTLYKMNTPLMTSLPIATIAGNGTQGFGGDGGLATAAVFNYPTGLAQDNAGNLYISDTRNNRIRRIAAGSGIISTIAGNGAASFSGDGGPATAASFYGPWGLAVDANGNLLISDAGNNCIRRVQASNGAISTIIGLGPYNDNDIGDGGPAAGARLQSPGQMAYDGAGNLYIADLGNNRVRKVDAATGIISTVVGKKPYGFSGDGGPATAASIDYIMSMGVDAAGNVYIAGGGRIRKITAATGIIATIAGTGVAGYNGEGIPAMNVQLYGTVLGLAVDGQGNIYYTELTGHRVRKISAADGKVNTIAGGIGPGYSGDGIHATAFKMSGPEDIMVNRNGDLVLSDAGNNRIRLISTK